VLPDVGIVGESAVVMYTSYDVGEPDQPLVEAVITLPGVELPDRDTVPPEGMDTGAETLAVLEKAALPAPPELDAVTRQRIGLA
jgi:hypothetical protein